MKNPTTLITCIIIILIAISATFAWGGKNATGKITSLDNGRGTPYAIVKGYTEGGKLWLGFSYKCGNKPSWKDIDPVKVNGKFSHRFTMKVCPQGYSAIRSCLWKGKDGDLMEGRVDCYDK